MQNAHYFLSDEVDTNHLGQALAASLSPGLTIALYGTLGAGKTTLTRAALRALGITGTIKSPSYSWVESYSLPHLTVHHFDFYRFRDIEDWEAYGFDSYFDSQAVIFIEWPEKVAELLPPIDLKLQLDYHDSGRQAAISSLTTLGELCVNTLRAQLNTSMKTIIAPLN
ncbi:MAG: tRNA (adenosine(37)-N6)-threonylcarbamoyltransferase complex ATPase subunit type 1 TsaE [Pseudomonadota bacterium]